MKKLICQYFVMVWVFSLPGWLGAQSNPIETDANLKDTTTHVVVERKVYETTKTYQQETPREVLRKIAIIVQNRESAGLNSKVTVLEDLVASRVAGKGFSVISREEVSRSLKNYANGKDSNADLNFLDQSLEDNSSALRLAQNLGADFILVPSIVSLGTETKNYSGNGVTTLNITHRLRVSYKIVEAGQGGALRGGAFVAEKTLRQTGELQTEDTDIINELLDDAADQLADAIKQTAATLPTTVAKASVVHFKVMCAMTDPRHKPILIPTMQLTDDNRVVTQGQAAPLQALDVTVELDGVVLGSTPADLAAQPGLHKIRLSREGFDSWANTVNIFDGQNLQVSLQMNPAAYARWAETTGFLSGLDNNRKLTEAEAQRIKGIGEFFRNSHYRVDTKENINVTNKSIF